MYGEKVSKAKTLEEYGLKAKLYYFFGAMGSTKTAQLLTTNFNYTEKGLSTLLITSGKDNRSGIGFITSRIGLTAQANIVVYPDTNLFTAIENETKISKINVILVDEIQFFTPQQIDQLGDVVDYLEISVLCYGLKTDFQSHFFPATQRLMEIADSITEIKTICHCGKKATYNARVHNGKIVTEGQQILTGGNETYVAVCRRCWKQGLIKQLQKPE